MIVTATKRTKPPAEAMPAGWRRGEKKARENQLRRLPRRVETLLAAGWARSVLPIIESRHPGDDRLRDLVVTAERWATDPSPENRKAAKAIASAADTYFRFTAGAYACACACDNVYPYGAYTANAVIAAVAAPARKRMWMWLYRTYCHARGPKGATFDPRWRTETTMALARGIIAEHAFDRMPILADALEDAGCDLYGELARLRSGGDAFTLEPVMNLRGGRRGVGA